MYVETEKHKIIKIEGQLIKIDKITNCAYFLKGPEALKAFNIKAPLTLEMCKYYLQLGYKCYVNSQIGPILIHLDETPFPKIFAPIKLLTISEIKNVDLSYLNFPIRLDEIDQLIYKNPWYLKFLKKIVSHIKKLKNILIH